MKISLIVPCFNEEGNVKTFYEETIKTFKDTKYKIEIVYVNDGSKDNTLMELKSIVKESKIDVKVINFSRNFGKEAGIYAGLKECRGDYAVIIDADMQQPPKLILPMLKEIEKNSDVDIVCYYQEKRKEGKLLSLFKKMFYRVMSKSMNMNIQDGASDFRLFNRKVINTILEISEHDRFSKGIFNWIGYNTKYLPYVPEKRQSGKTSWSFKSLLRYGINGILSFSSKPLKIIYKLGIIDLLISLIWYIINIVNCLVIESYIIPSIVLLFGINNIVLGVISEYIYRSYNETRNRPIYIIKDVLSNEKNK